MSQNTTPAEYETFKRVCAHARKVAKESPCYHVGMALMPCYGFKLGPWNLRLTLDRFCAPSAWHGSVTYMQEIDTRRVTDAQGHYLFDVPEEGMTRAEQWDNDVYQTARDLLGDLFGELIHGEHQQIRESRVGFGLHWQSNESECGTLDS